MLKEVNPAVVNIATFSTNNQSQNPLMNDPFFRKFFNQRGRNMPEMHQPGKNSDGAGSGVVGGATKGIIMTNYHVVKSSDEVRVSLVDGREFTAEIKGVDPELDIAILKVDAKNLSQVKFGDSNNLDVGDFVVAIGNPFGLGQTVTTGIVSALGRTGLGIEGYENFIQTDASINPGNSAGALVSLEGNLIGINTAIIASSGGNIGIGFAIPVNMAKASMDQILKTGEVKRGQLGISIQDITPELRQAFFKENA
jgi:S1-C subfamily serine protease